MMMISHLFLVERPSERLSLDDAVETELLPLVRLRHSDDVAELLDNVVHHRGRLGVDDPLGAARQPVDLPLGVPPRRDGHDLVHARRHLPPAVLERFPVIKIQL